MRWFTVNVVAIRAVSPGSSFLSSAVAMADTPADADPRAGAGSLSLIHI